MTTDNSSIQPATYDEAALPSPASTSTSTLDLPSTSTSSIQPPNPPVSQPLPLPPTGAFGPAATAMQGGGNAAEGGGMGGGTLGPGNRAKTSAFMAKRRTGMPGGPSSSAPPYFSSLTSAPNSLSNSAPMSHHHPSTQPLPSPGSSLSGNGTGVGVAAGSNAVFPALHLHPLNDTFVPKQISLSPIGTRIKVGRQTNAKTVPNASNGYFDSKVLSRMHAEVWSEDNRIWIKDVKSSNGTFINGERLSPEGVESEAFELHTDDVVEFGIDIVSDDNKTIVHHKVAAKVFLVLSAEDAAASSREFASYYRSVGESPLHRRPSRGGAFTGGSFEHVLNRLQSELEKSRVTGSELGALSTQMNEIHDTLSGNAGPPPPLPPPYHTSRLPPLAHPGRDPHTSTIASLQTQLSETQASLASHIEKIRSLEGMLAEHDAIKREVGVLRTLVEESAKRDMMRQQSIEEQGGRISPIAAMLEKADDDDAASVTSVETVTLDSEWKAQSSPTSQPRHNGVCNPDAEKPWASALSSQAMADHDRLVEQNTALAERLSVLSADLDEATQLGQTLRTRHAEASEMIRSLEVRVQGLEKEVDERVAAAQGKASEAVEGRWAEWKELVETGWRKQQEVWEVEREKLVQVIKDWEARSDASGSESIGKVKGKKGRSRRKRRGSASSMGSKSSEDIGGKTEAKPVTRRIREVAVGGMPCDSDMTVIVGPYSVDDLTHAAPPKAVTPKPLLETSHIPYLSAAGVVLVGIAAFVLAHSKVKD